MTVIDPDTGAPRPLAWADVRAWLAAQTDEDGAVYRVMRCTTSVRPPIVIDDDDIGADDDAQRMAP